MRALGVPPAILAAGVFTTAVAAALLIAFDGAEYYGAPLGTRGYLPAHRWLRPSGDLGLWLGVAGTVCMLATLPYLVRKRWRRLARAGHLGTWLEIHIFFGVVGPLLITFHTSFKFNGLISVGYWLLMTVWASGFVGRYLYGQIQKAIRGIERQDAAATRWLAHLHRMRRWFELWHVFHRPLVVLLFVIVAVHIGVAVYLGYGRFWESW